MAVFLNENCFEPSLEEMTHPGVAFVVRLGIDAIELPHSFGQISIRCLNDQVIVIVHQAVSMANPVKAFDNVSKCIQEVFAIAVIPKDRFAFVSARCDMVKRTVVFNS